MASIDHQGHAVFLDAAHETIDKYGTPEMVNTGPGSQLTNLAFIDLLKVNGIRISMGDKVCWRDNAFFERLWRTIKYEEVYLRAHDTVSQAKVCSVGIWTFTTPGGHTRGLTA